MNKTVNINLSGLAFIIDENAFDLLSKYLETIRSYFKATEGKEEILSDIESRFAEMFKEKLKNQNEVISMAMVEEVIVIMGQPEDFAGEDDDFETQKSQEQESKGRSSEQYHTKKNRSKRIYRNGDEKVLGGVCSGAGLYFDVDPVWFRLAFVLSVLVFGTGFLLYIILWLIIPEAKSTAEKLEMRGEDVNVSNIGKTVKDEFQRVADNINEVADDISQRVKKKNNEQNIIEKIISFLFNIVKYALKFALKIIALFLVVISLTFIVILTLSLAGIGALIPVSTSVIAFFAGSVLLQMMIIISLILFVAVPFIALLYHGMRLLLGIRKPTGMPVRSGLGILWLIGVLATITTSIMIANEFSDEAQVDAYESIAAVDTFSIQLNIIEEDIQEHQGYHLQGDFFMLENGDDVIIDNLDLDFVPSENEEVSVHLIKSSHGNTRTEAGRLANNIKYNYQLDSNGLILDDLIRIASGDPYRDQSVNVEILLPVGTIVKMNEEVKNLAYHSYDHHFGVKRGIVKTREYIMQENGLHCISCNNSTSSNTSRKSRIKRGSKSTSYDIDKFKQVEIDGFFDIIVNRADTHSLVIHGSDKILSKIEVRVNNDQLEIQHDWDFLDLFKKKNRVTLVMTLPELESLETKGASNLDIDGLDQDDLYLELSGATDANIDVTLKSMSIEMNGAADVKLEGVIDELDAEINGAASLNARSCQTKKSILDLSGASDAIIRVSENLIVDASGASDVKYIGDPIVVSNLSGACSISQIK